MKPPRFRLGFKIKPEDYGYVFILPFFLVVLVFQAYPLFDTLWTSLTDENMSNLNQVPVFIGWANYATELQSELLQQALLNTVVVTAGALFFQMLFALLIAAFLTSADLNIRRKNAWQVVFFLPSQISVAILSLYILYYFSPEGILGLGDVFSSPFSPWAFLIGGTVFLSFGITAYFLINSIKAIPRAVFEAAAIDGASGRQVFFRVSLPNLQPILIFLVVISLILDLCLFDLPYALYPSDAGRTAAAVWGGDQTGVTLGTYAYQRSFIWDSDLGAGASVVMMLFVLIASLSLIYFRIMKKTQDEFSVVS